MNSHENLAKKFFFYGSQLTLSILTNQIALCPVNRDVCDYLHKKGGFYSELVFNESLLELSSRGQQKNMNQRFGLLNDLLCF